MEEQLENDGKIIGQHLNGPDQLKGEGNWVEITSLIREKAMSEKWDSVDEYYPEAMPDLKKVRDFLKERSPEKTGPKMVKLSDKATTNRELKDATLLAGLQVKTCENLFDILNERLDRINTMSQKTQEEVRKMKSQLELIREIAVLDD